MGTEDGLHVVETGKDEIARVHGEKKPVYTVQLIPSEQLVLIVSGRQRHVRLVPYLALEGMLLIVDPRFTKTMSLISQTIWICFFCIIFLLVINQWN